MSDFNPFAQVSSFFFPNEQGTNLKLREKIALAQMMRKQAYPKTLGEGFASIGDSISDVITARGLEKSDREAQAVAAKLGAPQEAGAITPVSSAPTIAEPSPVQAAAIAGGQDPTSQAPVSPSVQEGGPTPPPGPMFRPNLRTSPVMTPAAPAVPAPPDVPGAIRLSTPEQLADFRGQNPLPQNIPPPPGMSPTAPQRPSVADYGQKLVLASTPPPGGQPVTPPEDPRREIALTMLRQGQTGQPPVSPRPPAPAPQGVEVAPPDALQRIAQAQPQPIAGYVTPKPEATTGAPIIGPSKREMELSAIMAANQGNPYAGSSRAAKELESLVKARDVRQTEANERFKEGLKRETELEKLRETGRMDQAGRIIGVAKEQEAVTEAKQKNQLRAQFGNMPPDEVFKNVSESHKVANSAAKSLQASQAAMAAFDAPGGVITGSGANMRLDVAKFFTQMGLVDKGNVIANTETFRNAMAPVVASIMHQTSGTSQLSEGELRFAQRAAAGDITLDPSSIKQLMTIIDKGSKGIIADHQRKVDVLFGDSPQAKATFGVETPKAPERAAPAVSEGATATGPGGKKMIMRGGNWEPL